MVALLTVSGEVTHTGVMKHSVIRALLVRRALLGDFADICGHWRLLFAALADARDIALDL